LTEQSPSYSKILSQEGSAARHSRESAAAQWFLSLAEIFIYYCCLLIIILQPAGQSFLNPVSP
jgi:hypothetical protein